ncbi:MAG: TatD family hydrolase [Planctomycetales bacterium]|nr:TatD family hydrolase [Planctomycetales bacterium]
MKQDDAKGASVLIDTHTHLDDEAFDDCRDDVVERARQAGVSTMVVVGTTADASQKCVEVAQSYDGLFAAVGIQPNYVHEALDGDWQRVVDMVKLPKVVALGETGLDRYWDYAPLPLQQDYFDRHLRLSQAIDVPFIVHMRDSGDDIADMLEEARRRGPLRGVMHSFTGDVTLAKRCLDLGLYLSFAGMVTFKKSQDLRDVAAIVPNDRLLVETDCPYLSPEPVRGKRPNEPAYVVHTAACLAKVRGTSCDVLAEQTAANSRRLFDRIK